VAVRAIIKSQGDEPVTSLASGATVVEVEDESKKSKKAGFGKAPPPVRALVHTQSPGRPLRGYVGC
jgi:hypothetical protein